MQQGAPLSRAWSRLDQRLATAALRSPVRRDALIIAAAMLLTAGLGESAKIAAGIALFAASLPHGLMREGKLNPRLGAPSYIALYIAAAGASLAAFLLAPHTALAGFLALSLAHFAASDALASRLANLTVGLLAIGGSAFFQPGPTAAMLGAVIGAPIPDAFVAVLRAAGLAGALAAGAAALRGEWQAGWLVCALALVAALQPVLAVGAVFYLFHAAPIQRRGFGAAGRKAQPIMLAAALLAASGIAQFAPRLAQSNPDTLALVCAAGLALFVPHLLEDASDKALARGWLGASFARLARGIRPPAASEEERCSRAEQGPGRRPCPEHRLDLPRRVPENRKREE